MSARNPPHVFRQTTVAQLVAQLVMGGAMLGAAIPASAASCTWDPASGNWNVAANWSCGFVPTGGPDAASIAGSKAVTISDARSILTLNNGGSVNIDAASLTLAAGGSTNNTGGVINIATGAALKQSGQTITGGTINTTGTGALVANNSANFLNGVTLNGTVDLTSYGNAREQTINGATLNGAVNIANGGILGLNSAATTGGNQTIAGTGLINLNAANAHLSIDGSGTTTLAGGLTVQGQGSIGSASFVGGTNTLINQGLIAANVNGGTLTITPPANSGSLVNQGTLRASGGGTLILSTATDNTGGLINALNDSVVLQNGATITSGAISTSGTGVFRASGTSQALNGVNFSGTLDLSTIANSRESIVNGATINGAVNIANGGVLSLDSSNTAGGAQTVAGTAVINLNDSGARLAIEGTGSTTLASTVSVRGQGNIGKALYVGGTNVLTNNGLISADANGGTLEITAPGGAGSFINNGSLQAVSGGTLKLSTSVSNAGQINAGANSTIVQNGVRLNGVISVNGSGSFQATNSYSNVLDGANFTGNIDLTSSTNSRERIINGATINGAVNVANGGALMLDSSLGAPNQSLNGVVSINLNDANARLSIEGNGSATLGAGVTVHGQGNIGTPLASGGTNVLTNNGLISADANGGTLEITAPGGAGSFINNNVLQAVGGGTLTLSTGVSNAGQINAGANSTIVQNGVRLNGVINVNGAGSFQATNSYSNVLDGANFTGNIDLTSITNSRERIINGATINGVVNVANGGALMLDSTLGTPNQSLNGVLSINLNDANARLSIEGNGSTTLGAGVTVHGQGNIGTPLASGGTNVLTNNGLIFADASGGTLNITTPGGSGSVINNNVMQAMSGGTLQLSSNITNASGLISAQNGSTVVQNGVTLSGGGLAATGSGRFQVTSNGSNTLDNVALGGTLDLTTTANSRERIINGIVLNNAVINVANGGVLSLSSALTTTPTAGNQTISGTGTINLNDATARLSVEGNGTTTLASGVTVRGQGNIGTAIAQGGVNTLVNHGTILADGGTLSIMNPAGSGSLVGTGTLQTSGGTLNLTGLTSPITQGKLVMGGAGSALTMGTQNLTITNDYTNAQSGAGNTFNARAGVSGSSQILAGGGATQVIAGSNITNGSTNNATLTIGNVHVGANTFNYQVTDSSATGPTLRGGIQTNVNGANLTDSRLSGSGVTASNYSSSNGPLAVTYTAATAGAQSMSGQTLNLTSNFSNIADQKLNIVLGNGAAAYNLASGSTGAVVVANQRVGAGNTAALTVLNNAPNSSYTEALNASFAGSTGNVTSTSGAIAGGTGSGVAGGQSNATAMSVGIDTTTAGAKSGTATLNYVSNGTGSSGLGNTVVGSQTVNVSGNVYNMAAGSVTPSPIGFGNVHVGDAASQVLTVANTAAPGLYSEALNAGFSGSSGDASGSGSISNIAAGANNGSALQVGLNTSIAGAKTGSVTVAYQTDGTGSNGHSGLSAISAGSQKVNVTGAVYNLASSNTIAPISLVAHTGDGGGTISQALTITNTAPLGAYSEGLNSSFGGFAAGTGNTINPTLSGSITNLAAGATNNSAMTVGISTAVAGLFNGTVTVNQASNGAGTSGLGTTALASQQVAATGSVTAGVFNYAAPTINNAQPVDFGSVRIGTAVANQAVSISNGAPVSAFTEALNGSVVSAASPFTASGSFSGLQAGAAANTSISVGMNTISAGHQSGNVVLGFVSDGTGIAGDGTTTTLANQNLAVTGNVYRLASPTQNTAAITLASRVGDSAPAAAISVTNTSPDAYTEGLKASVTGVSPGFSNVGGAVANLAAQGTDASTLKLGASSTATSGITTGHATVSYASTGAGTDNAATDVSVGTGSVSLTSKVYQTAVASVSNAVNFGTVHVGDVVTQAINVANTASGALVDVVTGTISSVTGAFTNGGGNLGAGVAAGANSNALSVGLTTATAGVYNGTANLALNSHDSDLADVALTADSVSLTGTVNNYAVAGFKQVSGKGAFSGSGQSYMLDLGTYTQNSGSVNTLLAALNDVLGPSDLLDGTFGIYGTGFDLLGFNAFDDLAAGSMTYPLSVTFDTSILGAFSETIKLYGIGHNDSGYSADIAMVTLLLTGNVVASGGGGDVPEPGSLALVGIAIVVLVTIRRRSVQQQRS